MKTLLYNLFVTHWPRKLISVLLALVAWLMVNHTLTSTRNVSNVPVRIINLPSGKTIEGMQPNGRLVKKLTLTLVGNKNLIDELTPYDLEVVIDASGKPDEWIAMISKKNLVSLNPEIDISKGISRVYHPNFVVRLTKLVTDQIPIIITQPIGEAPRSYQFLDVWPYRLNLTVSGPEEVIKRLKLKEQRITFNLSDISKTELDALAAGTSGGKASDIVSYFVPDQWKQINIPILSDSPIEIDDPQSKALRIDFIRCNLLSIETPIPVSLYFNPEEINNLSPATMRIAEGDLVSDVGGLPMITSPLFANGVDRLFLETVRGMIEIVVIVTPHSERGLLEWSLQFINSRNLEDRYVATLMSDVSDQDIRLLQPSMREEYLRNRFRSYMNRFQLFKADESKFELAIFLKNQSIILEESSHLAEILNQIGTPAQ